MGLVTTLNPAILPDGSNADDAPTPKTNPQICNKSYDRIEDFNQVLADLHVHENMETITKSNGTTKSEVYLWLNDHSLYLKLATVYKVVHDLFSSCFWMS